LGINYLTSGGRSHIIYFMFFGLMIVMMRARKIFFTKIAILLCVALVLVGILGNFRRSTWKGKADVTTITQFNPLEAITEDAGSEMTRRIGSISPALAILERVPRDVPLLGGSSYVGLLAFPIPQALWPEKPQGIHRLAGETFFGLQAGMPPGMMAEAYWNFHIPGVIGVFLMLGLFHRGLMLFYLRNGDSPTGLMLYVILLFCMQGDSGSLPYMSNILIPLAVLVALSAVSARTRQMPRRGPVAVEKMHPV
jgi:hypothetical protein